ncbi:hypothetical protein CHS0354_025638, partial [Potamilus streckersoni]
MERSVQTQRKLKSPRKVSKRKENRSYQKGRYQRTPQNCSGIHRLFNVFDLHDAGQTQFPTLMKK